MPIGIGEEHEELRRTVQRWVEARGGSAPARALLDAEVETLPEFWAELAAQGWLGMHVGEEHGGQGAGLLELAVVVEELARVCLPGPWLATMMAAAALTTCGDPAAKELLPALVDGSLSATVALPGSGTLHGARSGDGSLSVTG